MADISVDFIKVSGVVVPHYLRSTGMACVKLDPNPVDKKLAIVFYQHCVNQPKGDKMRSGQIYAFREGDRIEGYIDPKQPTDEVFEFTIVSRGLKPGFLERFFS